MMQEIANALPLLLVVFVGLVFAYATGVRRGRAEAVAKVADVQIVARDLIALMRQAEAEGTIKEALSAAENGLREGWIKSKGAGPS